MPEALITYFGQTVKVNCDGRCDKAWGGNQRERVYLSNDEDDYALLADDEVEIAPTDPGTYEGGHAKPLSPDLFPNKWCVRECERCNWSSPGEWEAHLEIINFNERHYNMTVPEVLE